MKAEKDRLAAAVRERLSQAQSLRAGLAPGSTAAQDRLLLRAWQAERMAQTYADLLQDPRYCPATQFFLEDLYGAKDYAPRGENVVKVVGGMTRLLPAEALTVLAMALELDVLSEKLDLALAAELRARQSENKAPLALSATTYARAYRACGDRDLRRKQIDLVVKIGHEVERLAAKPIVTTTLDLMRTPARLMGLSELQSFLERGLKAFKQMEGAGDFLDIVARRERRISSRLFAGKARPFATDEGSPLQRRRKPVCAATATV